MVENARRGMHAHPKDRLGDRVGAGASRGAGRGRRARQRGLLTGLDMATTEKRVRFCLRTTAFMATALGLRMATRATAAGRTAEKVIAEAILLVMCPSPTPWP